MTTCTATRSPSSFRPSHPVSTSSSKARCIPVLRNMSASGLLASRVVPSYAGPPRRYYRITEQGRAVLQQWLGIWQQTRDFVDLFTRPAPSSDRTD